MDGASAKGLGLDPSNCSRLSMDEKRQIVYALSDWSHGAPEMLQSWSRQEILEVLSAESGKERKYTGLTKLKIIENLLKIVSEKKSSDCSAATDFEEKLSGEIAERNPKRQRKTDKPSHLPFAAKADKTDTVVVDDDGNSVTFCKNSACKARMLRTDAFCRRCSCCSCHLYDDNKDPSLWLSCSSEAPFLGESCGMSCHLECALKHERSGIGRNDKFDKSQDGSFFCIFCGKENDAIRPCRKQLLIARETRRVDILCYRVSLSQKVLRGTKSYQELRNIIDIAVKSLEAEVGPFTGLPVKKARGIVNRLSCGPEVQKLCDSAISYLDSKVSERAHMLSVCKMAVAKLVILEDVSASSVTGTLSSEQSSLENVVGYTLWHRKVDDPDYPAEPTCTLFNPYTKFLISGLSPDTEYVLKVLSLESSREREVQEISLRTKCSQGGQHENAAPNGSSLSNSSSVEDETSNDIPCINNGETRGENYLDHHHSALQKMGSARRSMSSYLDEIDRGKTPLTTSQKEDDQNTEDLDGKSSPDTRTIDDTSTDNGSNTPVQTARESIPFLPTSAAALPITPCKVDNINGMPKRNSKPEFSGKDLDSGSGKDEPHAGSSSKKRSAERLGDESTQEDDKEFGYYVKVIRWLECDGHIETGFRQKFLTWYSLRATKQEAKIVKVFVDTFIEDPESLAAQLIDTFSDLISNNKSTIVPSGFCSKLWH